MSQIVIHIDTDNEAFQGDDGASEVRRILTELSGRIAQWDGNLANWGTDDESSTLGWLRDVNGNTVGDVAVTR